MTNNVEDYKVPFWKGCTGPLPGRPSLRTNNKRTSFHEFQSTVNDAWTTADDDSETPISKDVSELAASKILNDHKKRSEIKVPPNNLVMKVPGRPLLVRSTSNRENFDAKLERFYALLSSTSTIDELRQLSWSGVPPKVRAVTWRLLARYLPMNAKNRQNALKRKRQDYWNWVKQYYSAKNEEAYQGTYHQIHIDVPRMNPSVPLFQQETVRLMFERVLFVWAVKHPISGYVQGINDLVTPFFVVYLQEAIADDRPFGQFVVGSLERAQRDRIEADCFWCLSNLLDGVRDHYVLAQPGIQSSVDQLQMIIRRVDNALHEHLLHHHVDYLQFSFRWFNNLLTRELPLRCIVRLWDTFLAESDSLAIFQLYVCAAFLLQWRKELMRENDFQGLMLLLQNLPTHNWTESHVALLVAEAYHLKFMYADAPNHLRCDRGDNV